MRTIKHLLVVLMLLCLLTACVKREDALEIELSPHNKSVAELSTKKHSESELTTIASFVGSIRNLNEKYPIECIRKTERGYRVTYYGDSSVSVLLFNNSEELVMGNVYSTSQPKEMFGSLSTSDSVYDVQKIDPNGYYPFLYTGRNDVLKQSTHYTVDGYLITIDYDEKYMFSSIGIELI